MCSASFVQYDGLVKRLYPPNGLIDTDGDDDTVDPLDEVGRERRPTHIDRPWVLTNMISSADGATAVDGVSGALGGAGDRAMFRALRGVADIVLAGASTVRQERYRPASRHDGMVERRRARGQADRPRIAVITASARLDETLPLFQDPDDRPIILTGTSADADRLTHLRAVAEVIVADDDSVAPAWALARLHALGAGVVLCEGGPSLNGQFVAAGLIDEWNLTIAPMTVAGDSPRAAVGPLPEGPPPGMTLERVWVDDEDFLFCRWTRRTNPGP
jgi:5-amino-6-(5-phosphoribosylamino)uracil reductase